ncbi:MAG: hypothetical protein HYV32_03330 [Candidatus Kerfeldbacteria bacterium]|nr:hypothetical protein [Candidatus Kerfeldbacteria bacterium]
MPPAPDRTSRREYKQLIHKKTAEQERAAVGQMETISFERVQEALWQLIPDSDDPLTVDWKNDFITDHAPIWIQRAEEEGLSEQMVLRAIGEVKKHISLRARTESRYEHTENLHDELQGAGNSWVKKTLIQLKYKCTESLAIIGQGPAKTEAARKQQIIAEVGAMHTGGNALQELLQGSFEKQIAQNRLQRYELIGGLQFTKLIDEYREGKITDRELTDNADYTSGLDSIAASLHIDEPFELGEPPVVIEHLTEPQKDAIRRHIRFVLRSEILQLSLVTDNSRVHRLAGLDDGNREQITQFITGISTSGTAWNFLAPVVGKAVVGATFGAFLASGGIAPALAVGVIGATAGAVRGSIRHRQIVRQRRVDIALDRFRNNDAIRSPEQLMGIITQNMEIAQRTLDAGTPPAQNSITTLYACILEATTRLQSSLTSDQQYITINNENPFANREQLNDTIENAHALLEQMIEALPEAQQAKIREDLGKIAKDKKKEFAEKKQQLETVVRGDKIEHVINSAITSGAAASVASIAMHVIHGMDISRGLDAPAAGYTQRPDDVIDILSDHSGMSRHATLRSVEVLELVGGVVTATTGIASFAAEHWYTGPTGIGKPRSHTAIRPMQEIMLKGIQGDPRVHETLANLHEKGAILLEHTTELHTALTAPAASMWLHGDIASMGQINFQEEEWRNALETLDEILVAAQALPTETQMIPVTGDTDLLSVHIALFETQVAAAHSLFAETCLIRIDNAINNADKEITEDIARPIPTDLVALRQEKSFLYKRLQLIDQLYAELNTVEVHVAYMQPSHNLENMRQRIGTIEIALESYIQRIEDQIRVLEIADDPHLQELNDLLTDLTDTYKHAEIVVDETLVKIRKYYESITAIVPPMFELTLTQFRQWKGRGENELNQLLATRIPDRSDYDIRLTGDVTINERTQELFQLLASGEQRLYDLYVEIIDNRVAGWTTAVEEMHTTHIQPIVDDKHLTPQERTQQLTQQKNLLSSLQTGIAQWRTFIQTHPATQGATSAIDRYATVVQGAIYQIDSFWRNNTERDQWMERLPEQQTKDEVRLIITAIAALSSMDDPAAIIDIKKSIKAPREHIRDELQKIKANPAERLLQYERLAAYEATNVALSEAVNELNTKIKDLTLVMIQTVDQEINTLDLQPPEMTPQDIPAETQQLTDRNSPLRRQMEAIQRCVGVFMHPPQPPVSGRFLTRDQLLTPHRQLEFRVAGLQEGIFIYTTPEATLETQTTAIEQRLVQALGNQFIDLFYMEMWNDDIQARYAVAKKFEEEYRYAGQLRFVLKTPADRMTQVLGSDSQQYSARMKTLVERAVQRDFPIFRAAGEPDLPEKLQYALYAFRHKMLAQLEELVGEAAAIQIGSELIAQLGANIETAIANANTVIEILEYKKTQASSRQKNVQQQLLRIYHLDNASPQRIAQFVSLVVNYQSKIPDPQHAGKFIDNQPLFVLLKQVS